MNRKAVVALVGLCYSTIYNLEKNGKFPSRRQISRGRVAWVRSEIMSWAERMACAAPCNGQETHIPTGDTAEHHEITPEITCTEKPDTATRSRFEPLLWLRRSP